MQQGAYQWLMTRIRDVCSPNLQVWSILDGSDPKKSKNKMTIFILFKNVTTFYSNIFWYVQPLRSFFAERHSERHTLKGKHRRRRSNSSLDIGRLHGQYKIFQHFWPLQEQLDLVIEKLGLHFMVGTCSNLLIFSSKKLLKWQFSHKSFCADWT